LAFKLKNNFKLGFFGGKKGNIYILYQDDLSMKKSPKILSFVIGHGGGIY
jgi:hypothetical protein